MRIAELFQIAAGFVPVNLATAANPGDWVSLKNYGHLAVVFFKAAGVANEDPTLTLEQAKDVAGTGAKALNFTDVYVKQGADLQAIGTFSRVVQAAANTYTEGTAGESQAIWIVEIDASELDVDNGFDCVRASVGDVGATSQLGCLLYVLGVPRYAPPVSAIVN